jgi:hypothetical protein
MAEVQIIPFISWSAVTAAMFAVVAIVYGVYARKKS